MKANCVTNWFGAAFRQLDPLLQALHLRGGVLIGEVQIQLGTNPLARLMGQRLARKLHIPTQQNCPFKVTIQHEPNALHWERQFADQALVSCFKPMGHYPTGYWLEETGAITLQLGVEIIEGGWYWRQQAVLLKGKPMPMWLLPKTQAYKRIHQGRYVFHVNFSYPIIGNCLSYSGTLQLAQGT